jgi:hypothetical protein
VRRGAALAALFALCAGGLAALVPSRPAPRGARPARVASPSGRDSAQAARPVRPDSLGRDTTAAGRGRGLPQRPSREFAPPDSVTTALLAREGYRITRYAADSVQFLAQDKEIRLAGRSLVQRDQSTLEADTVRYIERNCEMRAAGSPRLYDQNEVVAGEGMRYDACNKTGIIRRANTEYPEGSATWYVRGDIAVDNEQNRSYLSRATITSCDNPDPHYHFGARDVKWVSKDIMVSRPAVLYVADVPILWLPFIFQDLRRGRRSGIIPPQFGINDIIRNSPSYNRHVANLGYYWAMGDFSDAQATIDWYAQRFVALSGRLRYRWLDRFITGGVAYQELRESGGSTSRRISLSHAQDFSLASRLTASLDYASSSRIISRNAVDPVLAVATIDSRLNYSRRFAGGTLAIGGSRTQSLDKPQVTMSFPVVAFAPQPITIGRDITWTPSFNFTNATLRHGASGMLLYRGPGVPDTLLASTRTTSLSIGTPVRIGRWNWSNSLSLQDDWRNQRTTATFTDPADSSRTVTRTLNESFSTSLDWATGINLPVVLQGTWNLSPRLDIQNTGGGAFMIRNQYTGGRFVSQGKRLGFGASVSPTFFGLFGGIGPVARIRHAISPSVSWSYSPAATLPEDYARALSANGRTANRSIDARQLISIGLSQNFEAKLRPPPRPAGDTTTVASDAADAEGRKIKLLSIQTSGVSFDLEQAKKPGRTGWATGTLGNTFSSDLLRGFSFSTNHDLFEGRYGYTGARLQPYLTSVSMRFSLGESTLRSIGSLLGLGGSAAPARMDSTARDTTAMPGPLGLNAYQRGPLSNRPTALDQLGPGAGGARAFTASVSFDIQRQRPPTPDSLGRVAAVGIERQTLSGSISFSPTRHWALSWQTQYNFVTRKFGEHVVRLDRDMHDWRATFSFVQSPNGNFLFNFFIQLIDQPDIKFEYDQRNIMNR